MAELKVRTKLKKNDPRHPYSYCFNPIFHAKTLKKLMFFETKNSSIRICIFLSLPKKMFAII